MFKRILALASATIMCIGLGTTAFAAETQSSSGLKSVQVLPYDEKMDQLEWHDYTSLDSIKIEDTYSYDEFIVYLEENGFTKNEVRDFVGDRPVTSSGTMILYSLFCMDSFIYSGGYQLQPRFYAGLEYIAGSSSPDGIVSIGNPTIYTGNGTNCIFTGNLFYALYSDKEFYYDFDGDIYKNGSVRWTVGGQVGIGKYGNISGTISNGNGYVTNVSESGTYYSAGLNP